MDIGSIMAILALGIFVFTFIARPFFEKKGVKDTYYGRQLSSLLAERDRILTILQELDLDYAMGKIIERDYADQRSTLVTRGATVLKNIDLQQEEFDLRKESGNALIATEQVDSLIEAAITLKRKTKRGALSNYCGQCGNALQAGDQFCSRCGEPIVVMEAEA